MSNTTDLGLLLLHALPFDRDMWAELMSILPDQTYAPNLYEFGDDIREWAKSSLALVPSKKIIVVGCSVGGSCAIEVAKLAPDRVSALVLIGTKARHNPDPEFHDTTVDVVKSQGVQAAWQHYWKPLFETIDDRKVIDLARKTALKQSSKNLINGLNAFHTRPSRDEFLRDCNFPIHIVTGEHDVLPGIDYSSCMANAAKFGELHVIEGSGHYVPLTKPQELNTILNRVVRSSLKDR